MTDIVANFELQPEESISASFLMPNAMNHDRLFHRDYPDQHPIYSITGLQDALDSESSARSDADTMLEGLISAEETRARTAEESLSDDIQAENNRAINAEETLQDNIDAEETRAKNAEEGLSDDISSEVGTRASEITRVEGLITAEETDRINADNTLQGNINTEKTARENADTTLQSNINAEILSRQNADSALQSNIDAEALARGNADTALNTKIDNHIADKANPHQVTKAQVGLENVDNTADMDKPISTAVSSAFDAVEDEINDINSKIPNAASSTNQLADKDFVNSSIATNTANFIGTFNSVQELEDYSGTVTNNDYAFVVGTDSAGNTVYDRYKYTDATTPASWIFEYELNNSSFTAAQWNAINSGATTALVNQITTNQGNITTIQTTMSGYGNIVTHNVSEFATAAQGTKADTAVQPSYLATVATSGSYNDLDDKPTIGNATLTIQKNGTEVDTFTANATTDKSINIIVPTDTSDLTNGAGYQTASDVQTAIAGKQDTLVSGTNIKTINSNSILGSGNLNIDGLPSQTGQNGKFLSTDGTNPSWNTITIPSVDIDSKSINRNVSDELQTIGVIDQNNTSMAIKTWTGTKAQYDAIVTKDTNIEYFCTDSGELYLGDVKIGSCTGGLEIGDIGIAPLGIDELENKRRYLNGQVISQAQFISFTNKLKSIVALYPNLATTEVNWQAEVTNSKLGQCGKFVIDDVAGTIRLPKVVNIQGLIELTGLGTTVKAGLPNITGKFGNNLMNAGQTTTGAFSVTHTTVFAELSQSSGNGFEWQKIDINASDSDPIYGNSTTVQPEAVQYPYFIQVATGVETSIDVSREIELTNPFTLFQYQFTDHILNNASWLRADTFSWQSGAVYVSAYEQLLTEYNAGTSETADGIIYRLTSTGKKIALADQETAILSLYASTGKAWYYILDIENERFKLPRGLHGTVVQSYQSGTEWYRVYSDGWCEQGGRAFEEASIVVLLKPYINADYNVVCNSLQGNTNTTNAINLTSTQFEINTNSGSSSKVALWQACGYIAGDFNDMEKYLYFYVGETIQDANLINAGAILDSLANKVDRDSPHVVETYVNGSSWYRVYSDGWCEQGGIINVNYAQQTVDVILLKQYANVDYSVLLTAGGWAANGVINDNWQDKTTSQFTIYGDYTNSTALNIPTTWQTSGYIS